MKLWQLRYGDLARVRCSKCGGTERCAQMVLGIGEDNELVEVRRDVECGCQERAAELLAEANAPPGRLETAALGDLDWEAVQPAKARSAIQLYAERLEDVVAGGVGLVLTGDVGTGKTHVAVGLVRLACGLGIGARFMTMGELLEGFKATYDRGSRRRSGPAGRAGRAAAVGTGRPGRESACIRW